MKEKPISEIEKELYEVLAQKPEELESLCRIKSNASGCVFIFLRKSKGNFVAMNTDDFVNFSMYERNNDSTYIADMFNSLDGFTIIGHEPTLFNLMEYLRNRFDVGGKGIMNILLKLRFLARGDNVPMGFISILDKWEGNGLDNQSEETKRKLHDLIYKK